MIANQLTDVRKFKLSELATAILELLEDPIEGDAARIREMLEEIQRRARMQEAATRTLV